MNLFSAVEKLANEQERGAQQRHHAGSTIGCPRAYWYKLNGTPASNPPNIATLMKWDSGNGIELAWLKRLDQLGKTLGHEKPILKRLEKHCQLMVNDIVDAVNRAEDDRPYDLDENVTDATAIAVPWRETFPGCQMETGGILDAVVSDAGDTPLIVEVKSSHMTRTRMIISGYIPHDYLTQAAIYAERYHELPLEIHYIDRQTGYPYTFEISGRGADLVVGNRAGEEFVREWYNNTPVMEYVAARLAWMEELAALPDPPGEVRKQEIPAPRDKQKRFFVVGISGLEDHELWLPNEDYHLLAYETGELIRKKKQADNVKYNPGFCPYCGYRDLCLEAAGIPIVEEEEQCESPSAPNPVNPYQ